ncbi:MAG: hypothetical protein OIF36_03760 [Alphaproteobacteria bacterium]|nr:hypothetical protein [Alphaproteobacteria bacterium]
MKRNILLMIIFTFIIKVNLANARVYYYFDNLNGVMKSSQTHPFDINPSGQGKVSINIESVNMTLSDIDKIFSISLSYPQDIESEDISLSFKLENEEIISKDDISISGTGNNRTLTISKAKKAGNVSITLYAVLKHTQEGIVSTNINVNNAVCSNSITGYGHIIYCDNDGYYLISSAKDLLHISEHQYGPWEEFILKGKFRMTNDIYFPSNTDWNNDGVIDSNDNNGWNPLGKSFSSSFSGEFDGQNHIIDNIKINIDRSNKGFFGYTKLANIKNLTIQNSSFNTGGYTGALIGTSNTTEISRIKVINTDISSGNVTGGIVGYFLFSKITDSYVNNNSNIDIYGSGGTGGLIGYSYKSEISKCYTKTDVHTPSDNRVGGLIGETHDSIVKNTYATGNVYGASFDNGGLIGYSSNSSVTNSYATGDVGLVDDSYVGGLIGGAENNNTITNSYADWTNAPIGSPRSTGGLVGKVYSGGTLSVINQDNACNFVGVNTKCQPADIAKIYNTWPSDIWDTSGSKPKLKNISN